MIQVDVFWSFGMGACFACLAYKQLQRESSMLVNEHFVYCLLFLSLIFAPSGAYLLWEFPGWESMFMLTRETVRGGLACIFAASNVLLGVIGFTVAFALIRKGKHLLATSLWVWSYIIMIGILGFGYRRFLYAGSEEEWAAGVGYALEEFFSSSVFYTLLGMGVFVLPPLYYAFLFWPQQGGCIGSEVRAMRQRAIGSAVAGVAAGVLAYCLFILLVATEDQKAYLAMEDFDCTVGQVELRFGCYAPVLGFLAAESIFLLPVLVPLFFTLHASHPKEH